MNKLLSTLFLATMLVGCAGTKLDSAGPYNGKTALYATDTTLVVAYKSIQTFLQFELANRKIIDPKITQIADDIRKQEASWFAVAFVARDAFDSNPTPENKAALDNALKPINNALTAIAATPTTK